MRDREEGLQDSAESVQERKQAELQRSLWDLGLAWGLVLVCCTHHLGHWLHGLGWHGGHPPMHFLPPSCEQGRRTAQLACFMKLYAAGHRGGRGPAVAFGTLLGLV